MTPGAGCMDLRKLLATTHAFLESAQVRHALIGGLALGAHGVQRFTNDVDWLAHGDDRLALKQALLASGFVALSETQEAAHFGGHGPVDVLFANQPLSQEMIAQAPLLAGLTIKCLGPEAIIGLKIQAYINAPKRELRDKADIQALMEANPKLLWKDVKRYADLFDQWPVIQAIRRLAEGPE